MRPQRLLMQAFGPYREREELDFAELGPNRVFLIHGDTGAGKSTILDAIVFALYGDTSGGERRAEQMRCDSARADLPTEVVFDFALGERSFRVRRRPAQHLAAVRGGAGLVAKPAEVALWERTGCADGEEGRPLATKIREVEAQVKALLGFSCDQFRQVVVLPQGRFRELLSAGSDKREEILRQLFSTERFRELELRLAERAKQVRKDMEQVNLQQQAQLEVAGATDENELEALTRDAVESLERRGGEVEAAEKSAERAAAALQAACALEEAARALSEARAQAEAIEGRRGETTVLRVRLADAVRAERVLPAAHAYTDAQARCDEVRAEQARAEAQLSAARGAESEAVQRLTRENERQSERQSAEERTRELERLVPALTAWEEADNECRAAAGAAGEAERTAGHTRSTKAEAERRLNELEAEWIACRSAQAKLEAAEAALGRARRAEEQCRRLAQLREQMAAADREARVWDAAEAQALAGYQEAETRTSEIEERWRSGRAAALAGTLVAGEPCPVCGATDHPSPAGGEEDGVSDQHLADARAEGSAARGEYEKTRQAAAAARRLLAEIHAREETLREEAGGAAEMSLDAACAEALSSAEAVESLRAQADREGLEQQVEAARTAAGHCAREADAAADTCARATQALARAETRLSERAKSVPEELRAAGALEAVLAQARSVAAELEAAFSAAVEAVRTAREDRISREAALEAATAALGAAVARTESAQQAFAAALGAGGFGDEHVWHRHLLTADDRSTIEERLAAYQDELQRSTGRLEQAQRALNSLPPAQEVPVAGAALAEARAELDRALGAHADARSRLGNLRDVRHNLDTLSARADDIRAAYQTVGLLADAAGGQNESRVSFQRWVLGVYLDEVLATASRKLYTMSKGRYQFEREREVQSRRRPSGLDVAVFDEYSGTARPAVTLSGGESFLAALALALGLAETVQEHAAGTPLETIFIDEGFGALDPEALELAVEMLLELQLSGRLVGVISHVAELRQVIPARLEVRGGSSGSSARFMLP